MVVLIHFRLDSKNEIVLLQASFDSSRAYPAPEGFAKKGQPQNRYEFHFECSIHLMLIQTDLQNPQLFLCLILQIFLV